MCVVSAISDYYQRPGPSPWQYQPLLNQGPGQAQSIQTIIQSDPEVKEMLKKLIEIADRLDKKLGDVECHDESKASFLKALGS